MLPNVPLDREMTTVNSVLVEVRELRPFSFLVFQLGRFYFYVGWVPMGDEALRGAPVVLLFPWFPNRRYGAPVVGDLFWDGEGELYLGVLERMSVFLPCFGEEIQVECSKATVGHFVDLFHVRSYGAFRRDVRGSEGKIVAGRAVVVLPPWLPCERVAVVIVLPRRTFGGVEGTINVRRDVGQVDYSRYVPWEGDKVVGFVVNCLAYHVVNDRVFAVCVTRHVELCRDIVWDYVGGLFLRANALSSSFLRFFLLTNFNDGDGVFGIPSKGLDYRVRPNVFGKG